MFPRLLACMWASFHLSHYGRQPALLLLLGRSRGPKHCRKKPRRKQTCKLAKVDSCFVLSTAAQSCCLVTRVPAASRSRASFGLGLPLLDQAARRRGAAAQPPPCFTLLLGVVLETTLHDGLCFFPADFLFGSLSWLATNAWDSFISFFVVILIKFLSSII